MIDKYKEFKSNRRLVGTIKLVFWLIPITIIIIMSHSHSPKTGTPTPVTPEKKDYLTNLSEMTYFKFDYELDDIKYEGKFADNAITLYNEKANYLIKYDKVYYEKKDKNLYNYKYIYPKNIHDLVSLSELDSTTSYKDGSVEYNYISSSEDEYISLKIRVYDELVRWVEIEDNNNKIKISYYDVGDEFVIDESIYKFEQDSEVKI